MIIRSIRELDFCSYKNAPFITPKAQIQAYVFIYG